MTTRLGRFASAWPMATRGWSRRLQPHLSSGRMRPTQNLVAPGGNAAAGARTAATRGRGREAVYPTRFHQARRRHGRGRRAARQRPGVRPVRHRRRDAAGSADRGRREPARAAPEQVRPGRREPVPGEHQEVHRGDRRRGPRRQRELGGSAPEDGGRRQCRQRPRHRARLERRSASVPDPDARPHRRRRPTSARSTAAGIRCAEKYGTNAEGRWIAMPLGASGGRFVYRKSWVNEAGYDDDSGGSGRLPPARPASCRRAAARSGWRSATRSATAMPGATGWSGPTAAPWSTRRTRSSSTARRRSRR